MISPTDGGIFLEVRAKPRSSKPGVEGEADGALVVRLSSPPAEGAANEELVKILAKALGVPKSALSLARGQTSRHKRLLVKGVSEIEARERLGIS